MMDNRFLLAVFAMVAVLGCAEKAPPPIAKPNAEKPKADNAAPSKPAPEEKAEPTKVEPSKPVPRNPIEDPPVIGTPQEAFNFPRPPLEMPKVLLTNGESNLSLVKVGDTMPDLALPDVDGKPQQLSKLLGPKLTVVAFWNSSHPYAVEEIGDLGPVIAERFGPHGVEIVGVAERDSAVAAKVAIKNAGAKFVNLVDADGKSFDKIASAELPRTYLLDAQRKVLWFDTEYSRSTRRDLVHAIQFELLAEK